MMLSRAAVVLFVLPFTFTATLDDATSDHLTRSSRNVMDFGLKLQRAILAEPEHPVNVVMSPTSVVGVLALILLGSVGKTYEELVQSLGYSSDVILNQNHHRFFGEQLQNLNPANISSKTLYANAIFVDRDAYLRDIYKDFLEHVYHATLSSVDFRDTNASLNIINEWVSSHTSGKIGELLLEPPAPRTRLVLASALYFSGQWLLPFTPRYTVRMPFTVQTQNSSRTVEVESMLNMAKYRYAYSQECDCELLAIPYNDSATTFYVLKPRRSRTKTLEQVLDEFDAERIEQFIENTTLTNVVLRLPKMNVTSKSNLKEPLRAMGMRALFSPEEANFALMVDASKRSANLQEDLMFKIGEEEIVSRQLRERLAALPNPGLYVDTVLHEAAITIDEYGTEAAAATAGLMSRSATLFYVNSPFFFFIRNEPTKLVTFSAAVFDPTQ